MIIEPERSGKSISDVCIAFGVSRATWYKWKRRYDTYGIDGLKTNGINACKMTLEETLNDIVSLV